MALINDVKRICDRLANAGLERTHATAQDQYQAIQRGEDG